MSTFDDFFPLFAESGASAASLSLCDRSVYDFEETLDLEDSQVPAVPAAQEQATSTIRQALCKFEQTPPDFDPDVWKGFQEVKEEPVPRSFIEEEDDDEEGSPDLAWERELEQVICDSDRRVPIEENLQEELLALPVKDFNRRTRAMRLDSRIVGYLKLQRKRLKNRQAAVRSRSKKEERVDTLLKQMLDLKSERDSQQKVILQLTKRLEEMEKQLAAKHQRRRPSPHPGPRGSFS